MSSFSIHTPCKVRNSDISSADANIVNNYVARLLGVDPLNAYTVPLARMLKEEGWA